MIQMKVLILLLLCLNLFSATRYEFCVSGDKPMYTMYNEIKPGECTRDKLFLTKEEANNYKIDTSDGLKCFIITLFIILLVFAWFVSRLFKE